jgi:hypothetical protein
VGLRNSWQLASVDEKPQRGERLVETILLFGIKPHWGDRFFRCILRIILSLRQLADFAAFNSFYQSIASTRLEGKSLKGWYDYRKITCRECRTPQG